MSKVGSSVNRKLSGQEVTMKSEITMKSMSEGHGRKSLIVFGGCKGCGGDLAETLKGDYVCLQCGGRNPETLPPARHKGG